MIIFVIGFIFISILGIILHFVYEKSGHNEVVGIFSAVNESTWEHIKIALTPAFVYSVVDGYFYGNNPNYFFAKLIGILSIIIIIPLIFYTYTKIAKKNILFIDISSFFITVFLSQFFTHKILLLDPITFDLKYISLILLFVVFGFYLLATMYPLQNQIFKDPITKKYGLEGHPEKEYNKGKKK